MHQPKKHIYINRFTGDMQYLTKGQGKKLSEDWGKTEQIVNEKGERGMRIQLQGATVDILENKAPKVVKDVDKKPE